MALLERDGAVELDRGVDRLLGGLGGQQLGHRRERRVGDAGVVGQRGLVDEQPRRLGLRVQLGQPVGDRLVVRRAACRRSRAPARRTAASSSAVRAIPMANAPDAGPEQVERAHRHPEARAGLAQHLLAAGTGTSSKVSEPMAWAASMSRGSPLSPGESPGTAKAVRPRAPVAASLRANTV